MKLTSELVVKIAAPQEFVRAYILDVSNWEEFWGNGPAALRALVGASVVGWEGTPWSEGSVLVMKLKVAGIGKTTRSRATAAEPGEVCRFVQEMGLPGMKTRYTYTYGVDGTGPESCLLTYRTYADGAGTRFVPTIRREVPEGHGLGQVVAAAWRGAAAGTSSSGPEHVTAMSSRGCPSCDARLPERSRFCPRCGAQAQG